MSVTTSAAPRHRSPVNRWVAVLAAVLCAAVVLTLLYRFATSSDGGGGTPTPLNGASTTHVKLTERVVAILEKATPAEHTGHGHDLGEEPGRVMCTAEVYGFEPAEARTPAEVRRIYGYHLCAVATKGRAWDFAPKLVGPLVVELTEPPTVRVAEGGTGYQDRVRELVGERYYQQALNGFSDERVTDLRRRYQAEVPKG